MFFNNNSPTVEVKDNFLSSDEFEKLSSFLLSDDFCWFYSDCNVVENDGGMQYFHNFYNLNGVKSQDFFLLDPLLYRIGASRLWRVKANTTFKGRFKRRSKYHIDYKNVKTAIFYINTNNGGTRFKNKFIEAKENRAVIIPCDTMHAVVRHTDSNFGRFVINFNYFTGSGSGKGYVEK